MVVGTNRVVLGVGVAVAAIGGAAAWMLARGSDDAPAPDVADPPHDHASHDHASHDHGTPLPPRGGGFTDAKQAPNSAGSGIPADADGPGNLAVAWWPQDISLTATGTDATLRFQSTIVNLGGDAVQLEPGERVDYTVMRSDTSGTLGEVVGRGSAPLGLADTESFPVEVGVEIGRPISSFGVELEAIDRLAPQTAAIVGAGHDSQAITIRDATAGHYTLRQQIVRADGAIDATRADDARLTEFRLDGDGGILHLGSRYEDSTDTTKGR